MDTRSLEIFLAVAERGSITRAAEALGCSQPHVTRTIQDIENELGLALLERAGRRITLSEAGLAFEGEARRMVQAFAGLAERVRETVAGPGRVLRIAVTPAIGTTLLPQALALLPTDAPEIHLIQTPANAVAKQVRDGLAEIGISTLPLDTPGLALVAHYTAPAAALVHRDDPLAKQKMLRLADFAGRRLVTMLDPTRFQRQANLAFASRGIQGTSYVRTNAASTAIRLVRHLRAVALLDPISIYCDDLPDLEAKPVDAEVICHWGAVADPVRPIRPLVRDLLRHLEAIVVERVPGITIIGPDSNGNGADRSPAIPKV